MLVIQDPFGRAIEYLRISVTDRCNLRCVYCMPEHGLPYEDNAEVLSVAEILRVVRLLAAHGLKKVRITGGEPLVRAQDVLALVAEIAKIPQIADLGMTTNAVLLAPHAQALRDAGLTRINISLDTLKPERFEKIARFAKFEEAWAGLRAAEEAGFRPIKLNMVVMRGINNDELADFAALTHERDIQMRFLEYMPIGQVTPWEWRAKYVSNEEVLERLGELGGLVPVETAGSSTSLIYKLAGAKGTLGVISPISHKFCAGCNRLRLTANGALVPCLSDNYEYDLKTPLRAGASDSDLLAHVRKAVANKPEQSDFEGRAERGGSLRIMAQIGG
ncbi:MAG TPA: GTP 3',8-cyclase MoaA [Capsulimonadaceae bacterium]|nr:GTP 3',8-cyclase MoaA [Capsulimonadaceae bacterium]